MDAEEAAIRRDKDALQKENTKRLRNTSKMFDIRQASCLPPIVNRRQGESSTSKNNLNQTFPLDTVASTCFQRPGDQREHIDGQRDSGRHQILKNCKTTGIDAIHAEMLLLQTEAFQQETKKGDLRTSV